MDFHPSAFLREVFGGAEAFLKKGFANHASSAYNSMEKEPHRALFLFIIHFSIHIKGWIESIEVFVVQIILNDSECITVLTKSKRCGEALDT